MNEHKTIVNPFIRFDQYDKISDDVYQISYNIILRFNVNLSRTSETYGRQFYHKEFEYETKNSNYPVMSIKRSFDYYLSIENVKVNETTNTKEFIRIGVEEIMLLRQILNQAAEWFTSREYKDLYVIHNNQLIVTSKIEPLVIDHLPMDKYIAIEPWTCIISEEQIPGVRLYLSDKNNYADIPINKFMGFVYTINGINMYQSAQLMLSYIGRPEFGFNMTSYVKDNINTSSEETVTGRTGRYIGANNKVDFFTIDK